MAFIPATDSSQDTSKVNECLCVDFISDCYMCQFSCDILFMFSMLGFVLLLHSQKKKVPFKGSLVCPSSMQELINKGCSFRQHSMQKLFQKLNLLTIQGTLQYFLKVCFSSLLDFMGQEPLIFFFVFYFLFDESRHCFSI